jgi:ATP-binding cassette subfamily B protein
VRKPPSPTLSVLKKILSFLKPYSLSYIAGIIGIGFANFLINAFLARMLMDLTRGIMELSRGKLALTTQIMIGGTLFMVAWVFGTAQVLVFCIHRTSNDIRKALFRRFVEMPLTEIEERHSGDLLSRSTTSLRQVSSLLMGDVQMFMNVAFPGIGCAVYMLRLDPRMGIAGILCGIVPLVVNLPFAEPLRKAGTEHQAKQAAFTEKMSDLINGRDTIRHLNLGSYAAAFAGESSREVLKTGMRQVGLSAARSLAASISDLSSHGFFIYVSILGIRNPTLIPAAVAMMQLGQPVRRMFGALGNIIASISTNLGGVQRVTEVLDIPGEPERYERSAVFPEASQHERLEPPPASSHSDSHLGSHPDTHLSSRPNSRPDSRLSSHLDGHPAIEGGSTPLRVSGLSFTYRRSERPALAGVSFVLEKGRRTALVGPSGGGKSTLVKLIMGLYPPASGEIVAFGRSIYETPLGDWRRSFSYVPQDAFLLAGTVYENILGGLDDPGWEKVEEAAILANAHDFIAALPDGYGSPIGERGANLSGGQKQRIAIARAVLRDSPILLLDEATASLDAESESLVQDALNRLMANRTTLVVAHRLSTVREADEILVMENGTVVERGRHTELMALGGTYMRLVEEGLGKNNQSPEGQE